MDSKVPCAYCGLRVANHKIPGHCDAAQRPVCVMLADLLNKGTRPDECPFCRKAVRDVKKHLDYSYPRCSNVQWNRKYDFKIPQKLSTAVSRLATPLDGSAYPTMDQRTVPPPIKFRHHVGLAKSDVWLSMLSQQPPDELAAHQWTCGQTDYNLVLWSGHLNAALREGLQYPILIPGESPLGQDDAVVGDACGRLSTSLCCPLPAISSFVTALILQRRQKPLRR